MNTDCIVLTTGSLVLGVGLYLVMPKSVVGERRTLRWIGVLVGILGLLS